MPSLRALQEFKTSFNDLGGEFTALAEKHLPFDELPLPKTEAVIPTPKSAVPVPADTEVESAVGTNAEAEASDRYNNLPDFSENDTGLDSDDLLNDPPSAESGEAPGDDDADFDFGAFLNAIPDNLAVPDPVDLPGLEDPDAGEPAADDLAAGSADLAVEESPAGTEDFGIPDDLLNGLAEDVESGVPDFPADESADESAEFPDLNDFNISGLEEDTAIDGESDLGSETEPLNPGIELPAEEALSGESDLSGFDDFDMSGLDIGGETESSDLGDSSFAPDGEAGNIPDEAAPESGKQPEETYAGATKDIDFGNEFSKMDLSTVDDALAAVQTDSSGQDSLPEEFSDDESLNFSAGEDGDDGFGMDAGPAELPFGDLSTDSFDAFNLEGDKLPDDFTAESAKGSAENEFLDLEEFSLPGIDDVFAGITAAPGAAPRGKAKKGETHIPEVAASDDVEEIQLSAEELVQFQKTLSGYPLNLRIACEELIAEQAVAPDQMSQLVKLLIRGGPAKETAALAEKILGRTIPIPKGFEKKTGEELEAEQASFAYIFVHNFLPVLRLFMMIAVVASCLFYLVYHFIYTPLRAESIYKLGLDRIENGEYERANDRFTQAFGLHRVKDWFYKYAEGFRDQRQYRYAEEKYDELLRQYPRDKKGVLDYAALETYYLRNYEKADTLLRRNILDYAVNDSEALLALGDNALAWGESDPSKYEDARFAYARLLDNYGWTDPIAERMMKYFIRTDNLKEVFPLQSYFMDYPKRKIAGASLAELGGYLLDKRVEEARGVPNEYIEQIQGVRDVLLRAIQTDPVLPEGHYHLSRYYRNLNNLPDEQITLEAAIHAFDRAKEESIKRLGYRIEAQRRYANILISQQKFFPAEEQLIKGIDLYEDGLTRRLLAPSAEYGKLYADLGDLEYFTKAGNMETALQYYLRSERNGWAPPEIQYRMGSAYYHQQQWTQALERFFAASSELPLNRRILLALGNVSYQRGNYFAAQGYYNRLLDILEGERSRLPLLLPNERPEYIDLAERLMIARNNMGVTLEALSRSQGNTQPRILDRYRSRALGLYTESARAWDTLTRNPDTMVRLGASDFATPGINLAFLNSRNALYPVPDYDPQLYLQIDKDVLEPSPWEALSPQTARLTE